jgi:hypothetical protein
VVIEMGLEDPVFVSLPGGYGFLCGGQLPGCFDDKVGHFAGLGDHGHVTAFEFKGGGFHPPGLGPL